MTTDPNHTANQYAVARRLVPVLTEAGVEETEVQALTVSDWKAAVGIAQARERNPQHVAFIANPSDRWKPRNGYVPSESTRRLIALMLKTETAPAPTTDPFAGLPGVDD